MMKPIKAWAYVDGRGRVTYSSTLRTVDNGYRLQPDVFVEPCHVTRGYMPLRLVRVEIREVPAKRKKARTT